MVALTRRIDIQMKTEGHSEQLRSQAADQDPPQLNPLWQSLTMRSGVLQPKLTIGQADDPHEREADRVADQVMRMPDPQSEDHALSITPVNAHQAQRKCASVKQKTNSLSLTPPPDSAVDPFG
jgi:hypothetical protein